MNNQQKILLGEINVTLQSKGTAIRLLCEDNNALLEHQSVEEVTDILTRNFEKVTQYYRNAAQQKVAEGDLQRMSISIVVHYLYMYNKWRKMYTGMADLDLGFKEEDFEHPGTYDIILYYCKQHFPKDWVSKAAAMVGKTDDEVRGYNERRQQFFDMR